MDRPQTPPPRPVPGSSTQALTPEQVKKFELNRLRAKAKLREREAARAESSTASSSRNANNKRPLQVTPANSTSPTAPHKTDSSSKLAPLKRDSRLGSYFEYDLSKMVDSKGGFLTEEGSAADERIKMLEQQRAEQRAAQKLDPPVFIDPALNPKCRECGSIDIDQTFKRVFGLLVCEKCKLEKPEKYSLLTKTECKEDYLLTDPELRDHEILPHLLKANPHKATYNNMMLFVRLQVETFAFEKWGSPEGLDKEWDRRTAEAKKKKGKKFEKALRDLRRKTREGEWQMRQDSVHKHEFGVVEAPEDGPGVQRCLECGFEIEVEEL